MQLEMINLHYVLQEMET